MNTLMKSLVPFLLLASALPVLADTRELRREARPGQCLEVNLKPGGAVSVRGGAESAVVVRIHAPKDSQALAMELEGTSRGASLHWKGGNSRGVKVEITVPARFDLDLRTQGGELQVEGVEGDLKGATMGGSLDLKGLRGKVAFSTMGGAIRFSDSQADGKVSTMGGALTLQGLSGDLKASTMGGEVTYDGVRRPGQAEGRPVEVSTMGGAIKVGAAPFGAQLKTMGGAIHVGSAGGFVKASTMGGAIEVLELDGGVEASTMGGDVKVRMVGDPAQGRRDVKVTSKGGEVVVTLPAALSMDVDVELSITRGAGRDYRIQSDFPLSVKEGPTRSEEDGVRRTLKGTGTFNGGRNHVIIRTSNGNVTIRKG